MSAHCFHWTDAGERCCECNLLDADGSHWSHQCPGPAPVFDGTTNYGVELDALATDFAAVMDITKLEAVDLLTKAMAGDMTPIRPPWAHIDDIYGHPRNRAALLEQIDRHTPAKPEANNSPGGTPDE